MVASKLILFISLPFFAHFGDRIGHKRFLISRLIVLMLFAYPVFLFDDTTYHSGHNHRTSSFRIACQPLFIANYGLCHSAVFTTE